MARLLTSLLLLGFCVLPEIASAQSPTSDPQQRARELFENGVLLYEEAQYEQAILAWEEAYRLSERALFLFNIANAYERLGDLDRALDYLHRYRAFAPADERATLERRIRTLEQRQEELRQAQGPPDAPAPAPLAAGPPAQPAESPSGQRNMGWLIGLSATSLATAATGVYFALDAQSQADTLERRCSGGLCTTGSQSIADREQRSALLADIAFGVAAVSAIGAIALALASGGERPEASDPGSGQSAWRWSPLAAPTARSGGLLGVEVIRRW